MPETEASLEEEEKRSFIKCAKCKRQARKDCTQSVCLKCCDDDGCEVHKEQREQALFREEVFAGTSLLQLQAKDKRSKLVAKGRFREPGFCYMGDTVVIWNLREYLDNPKWKEDALRKSIKRKARSTKNFKPLKNSRKRFHRIMEELYQKTLQEPSLQSSKAL